jgi:hypothetical protein
MAKIFDHQQSSRPKSDLARSLDSALSGCGGWVAAPPRARTNTVPPPLAREQQHPYGVERRAA